jgi:hypothetical protein
LQKIIQHPLWDVGQVLNSHKERKQTLPGVILKAAQTFKAHSSLICRSVKQQMALPNALFVHLIENKTFWQEKVTKNMARR